MMKPSNSVASSCLRTALLAMAVCVGCSQPKFYPVRGEVVVFGVGKLTDGEVQFRPLANPKLIASGKIQKDGTFSLSTPGHGEGVLEGDCQAAVLGGQLNGKAIVAPKFEDFDQADRNFTVTNRLENYWIIQVERGRK